MSAGQFTEIGYVMNNGQIMPVKVQPETLQLVIDGGGNVGATGGITRSYGSARVSGSARQIGVRCRGVYLRFTGAPAEGYEEGSILRVPILNPGFWNGIDRGDTGVYLETGVTVVGKYEESVR